MSDECKLCGAWLGDEIFKGETCTVCELEQEKEEAEAIEAEYEDRRWDLAHEYGYDHP